MRIGFQEDSESSQGGSFYWAGQLGHLIWAVAYGILRLCEFNEPTKWLTSWLDLGSLA